MAGPSLVVYKHEKRYRQKIADRKAQKALDRSWARYYAAIAEATEERKHWHTPLEMMLAAFAGQMVPLDKRKSIGYTEANEVRARGKDRDASGHRAETR